MPKKEITWKRGPAEVVTSSNTTQIRDGSRMPSDVQFVQTEDGSVRAAVPDNERTTHKLVDYELADVKPKVDGRGDLVRDKRGRVVEEYHYRAKR